MGAPITSSTEFDLAAARGHRLPPLALRRRSAEHPMAMFALATGMALMSMAFASASSGAVASIGQPLKISDEVRTTAKQDRLPADQKEVACHGQAWGAETDECLTMIARESGRGPDFKVRKLASAAPMDGTPNIY